MSDLFFIFLLAVLNLLFHSITEGDPSAGADLKKRPSNKKALILQEPNIKVENINLKT